MAAVSIEASVLAEAVASLFVTAGLVPRAAATVADDLVRADLEGVASHGVMLAPMYLERLRAGGVSRNERGEIVSDRGGAVVLDAGNAFGQLTSHQAVDIALERSRRFGLAAVTVRNAFHFGMAGRYARRIADGGAIGLVMSNTRPLMPAPGGAEARIGNNPLAIAVPSAGPYPAEVDMALSASAMGKIRLAEAAGEAIPDGWAVDREGQPTTDPAAALAGMLLPAAGAKGFGLAFVIDLLCGGLSSGGTSAAVRPLFAAPQDAYNCSHAFIAIDVAHFCDAPAFETMVEQTTMAVSQSKPASGTRRVYAPGELAHVARMNADGRCRLNGPTVAALVRAGASMGVTLQDLFDKQDRLA